MSIALITVVDHAMAQEDFPRIQLGVSGANMRLPAGGTTSSRHVGFVVQTGVNFGRLVGIENYNGFYSMGRGALLATNIVGARLVARPKSAPFMHPYGVVGVGVAHITPGGYKFGSGNMLATRVAGGADFPLRSAVALRVDVGLLSVRPAGSFKNAINGSFGFAFRLK